MTQVEIIVQFSPAVAAQFAQAAAGEQHISIERLLHTYGAVLMPLHPGSDDSSLKRYFRIQMSNPEDAEKLVERLRKLPGTEAAYIKPSGEPP
jgi:hypothetical protein